jgi:hypothetical protein
MKLTPNLFNAQARAYGHANTNGIPAHAKATPNFSPKTADKTAMDATPNQ